MDWIIVMGFICNPAMLKNSTLTVPKCEAAFKTCTDNVEKAAKKAGKKTDRGDAAMFCYKSAL